MIVPRPRLLWGFAFVVLPGAALVGLLPDAALPLSGAVFCFLALAFFDATRGWGCLGGFSVSAPDSVRLFLDRPASLVLTLRQSGSRIRSVRMGLALPASLETDSESLNVLLPEGAEPSQVTWPLKPVSRGRARIGPCALETSTPWGLWSVRSTREIACQARVYPNLFVEGRRVASLFLTRGGLGVHAVRQVGKGRDFEKLREYIPGDPFEDVHWKATARRCRPVTKVYQIERTQEVYVILDASRLSARPASAAEGSEPAVSILDRYLHAALLLSMAAERSGDRFGLMTFSDQVHAFLSARNGKVHYQTCLDAVCSLFPRPVAPDFGELFSLIRLRLRKRALLVFLTCLDDPVQAESFCEKVDLVRRQHLVLVGNLLPAGVRPLFSGEAPRETSGLYDRLAGHLRWRALRELERSLRARGVRLALMESEAACASLIAEYVNIKRRQLL